MSPGVDAAVRFADLVHSARLRNASDVHVAAGMPSAIRIDGVLEFLDVTFDLPELRMLVERVLTRPSRQSLRRNGDGTGSLLLEDGTRARVHVFRSGGHPLLAIRLLEKEPPSLERLELPAILRSFASRDHGLVVLAGPTGCGKSTTLAALVAHINQTLARRILTIEDPIEYRHRNRRSFVSQREVGVDAPSLGDALIGALRSDPDVLVVGEARDASSMRPMLTAAETGHLVLATLHTGTAADTADRIVDVFDAGAQSQARVMLAQTLIGIVCQRLVRRPRTGRRVIAEILVGTPAVKSLIRQSKTSMLPNAIATGRRDGMQTFAQHAQELAANGEVRTEEIGALLETPTPAA